MASNDESIIICSPKSTKFVSNASYSSKLIENLLKNKKNDNTTNNTYILMFYVVEFHIL